MSEPHLFNTTAPVVMAHPNLFVAKAFKRNGKELPGSEKFGAQFVFDNDSAEFKAIKSLCVELAKARWPGRDIAAQFKAGQFAFPWESGDKAADKRKAKSGKDDGDYQRGKAVVKARSKYRPALCVLENGGIVDLTDDAAIALHKKDFFFGAEVLAQFNFQTFEGGNGPDGVCAYLNMVLSTKRGKKIAGAGTASGKEVFSGYVGQVSGEDPLAGADPNEGIEDLI